MSIHITIITSTVIAVMRVVLIPAHSTPVQDPGASCSGSASNSTDAPLIDGTTPTDMKCCTEFSEPSRLCAFSFEHGVITEALCCKNVDDVCCGDKEHCCPKEYKCICNSGQMLCEK